MRDSISKLGDLGKEVKIPLIIPNPMVSSSSKMAIFTDSTNSKIMYGLQQEIVWTSQVKDRTKRSLESFKDEFKSKFPLSNPPIKRHKTAETYGQLSIIIADILKHFPMFSITVANPPEVGVKIKLQNVYFVSVTFKEVFKDDDPLRIEQITISAPSEQKSSWELSNHRLFQKISELAIGAAEFYTINYPETVLKRIVHWLSYYRKDMFDIPCNGCGKRLYDDSRYQFLPPSFRTYVTGKPYHPQCLGKNDTWDS